MRSCSLSSNQMLDRTNFVSTPTSRGVAIRGAGARPRHPLFALYVLWGLAYYNVQSPLHAYGNTLQTEASRAISVQC